MKILITGSNGLLGQKLLAESNKYKNLEILATSRTDSFIQNDNFPFIRMDITDFERVDKVVTDFQPDAVIHAAGMSQVDYCELNRKESTRVNYEASVHLAHRSDRIGAHFVFLSSDFIFSGERGHYDENDIPLPGCEYGHQKFNVEKFLISYIRDYAIVRTSLVYGYQHELSRSNIFLWIKNSLDKGKSLQVVSDQYRTPTLAEDLAHACMEIAFRKKRGFYNIAGSEFISVYEFARKIARYYHFDDDLIRPVTTDELKEPAKRPLITGLTIGKAIRDLDYKPRSIEEGIDVVARQIDED